MCRTITELEIKVVQDLDIYLNKLAVLLNEQSCLTSFWFGSERKFENSLWKRNK